jgi:hypothetical protein
MAMPVVILLLALCLSAVQLSGRQLQLQDAAADAARIVARGEGAGAATRRASELLSGVTFEMHSRGDLVCVRLHGTGAPGLFGAVSLRASSCALGDGR